MNSTFFSLFFFFVHPWFSATEGVITKKYSSSRQCYFDAFFSLFFSSRLKERERECVYMKGKKKENSASFLLASDNCCHCYIRTHQLYSFVFYLYRTDLRKKYTKMTTKDTSPNEVQRNTSKEKRKEWRVRASISMY
jgi:hypothetical protein